MLEFNLLYSSQKITLMRSWQAGQTMFTASQFALCLALIETRVDDTVGKFLEGKLVGVRSLLGKQWYFILY